MLLSEVGRLHLQDILDVVVVLERDLYFNQYPSQAVFT